MSVLNPGPQTPSSWWENRRCSIMMPASSPLSSKTSVAVASLRIKPNTRTQGLWRHPRASHCILCLLLPVPPQPHTTSCRPLDRNGSLVYGLCLPSLPAFNFSWKVSVAWKLVYSALLLDSPSAFFVINKWVNAFSKFLQALMFGDQWFSLSSSSSSSYCPSWAHLPPSSTYSALSGCWALKIVKM